MSAEKPAIDIEAIRALENARAEIHGLNTDCVVFQVLLNKRDATIATLTQRCAELEKDVERLTGQLQEWQKRYGKRLLDAEAALARVQP